MSFTIHSDIEAIVAKVKRVQDMPDSFSLGLFPQITMLSLGEDGKKRGLSPSVQMGIHGPYYSQAKLGEVITNLTPIDKIATYHPAGGLMGGGPWAETRFINGKLCSVVWIRASLHQIFCQIPEQLLDKNLFILHQDFFLNVEWEERYKKLWQFSVICSNMIIFEQG